MKEPSGQNKNAIIAAIQSFLRGKHSVEGERLFHTWWNKSEKVAETNTLEKEELEQLSDRVLQRLRGNLSGQQPASEPINPNIHEPAVPVRRITMRAGWWRAAAAILLIAGTGGYLWYRSAAVAGKPWLAIVTKGGEVRKITLSDGTLVTLNEKSRISYPGTYAGREKREITLEGEAFFDIAKDPAHPFMLTARHATIQVLGTRFDVLSHQADSSVVVAMQDGKVSIRDDRWAEDSTLVLVNGEVGILRKTGELARETAASDNNNYFSWMDNGSLNFDGTPLSQVVVQLERIYGCRIVLDDPALKQRKITLRYPKSDPGTIISVIGRTMKSTVLYANNEYHIK